MRTGTGRFPASLFLKSRRAAAYNTPCMGAKWRPYAFARSLRSRTGPSLPTYKYWMVLFKPFSGPVFGRVLRGTCFTRVHQYSVNAQEGGLKRPEENDRRAWKTRRTPPETGIGRETTAPIRPVNPRNHCLRKERLRKNEE